MGVQRVDRECQGLLGLLDMKEYHALCDLGFLAGIT